jgi:hypothetical protein
MDSPENYQAYLLRLWREDEASPWRASLQDARVGQLLSFASVAQLIAYIEQRTVVVAQRKGNLGDGAGPLGSQVEPF